MGGKDSQEFIGHYTCSLPTLTAGLSWISQLPHLMKFLQKYKRNQRQNCLNGWFLVKIPLLTQIESSYAANLEMATK